MGKVGRPPKPPDEKTTSQTSVRLTDDERAQLDELALMMDVTAGEVLRRALAAFYKRVKRAGPG